ncbi:hypothetical protein CAOG_08700 [Capsaspora owczarzaki ATCC 30864]|uniref:Phosphoinositide phospholipase C n=1 Tax=Capsaspora owczarzaki (strain ATCC 30864) TaxID=595528 RepID=A0A0D2X2F7_CAPO3|nr:hypothetical protein CAOG_08700 [Capsaspora owczarzaki ATCC 30864]KJE92479.1 hypothetical protein CAOG_008700 [Capsaspora owczarzaki ATCC 30864]|eukprot:XP_011270311.1 hypothetical protein CAOG_08700 [Capsaspora owczarzaki ATCC 30864]
MAAAQTASVEPVPGATSPTLLRSTTNAPTISQPVTRTVSNAASLQQAGSGGSGGAAAGGVELFVLSAETRAMLHDVAQQMLGSLRIGTLKLRMKTYRLCFTGKDAVTWLLCNNLAKTKEDAIRIGNMMIIEKLFRHVTNEHLFKNEPNLFYRFAVHEEQLEREELEGGRGGATPTSGSVGSGGSHPLAAQSNSALGVSDRTSIGGSIGSTGNINAINADHSGSFPGGANGLLTPGMLGINGSTASSGGDSDAAHGTDTDIDSQAEREDLNIAPQTAMVRMLTPEAILLLRDTTKSLKDLDNALRKLGNEMLQCLDITTRKTQTRTFKDCFVGKDAVAWMIQNGVAADEQGAIRVGNMMVTLDIFHHVLKEHTFKNENLLYRFTVHEDSGQTKGSWVYSRNLPVMLRVLTQEQLRPLKKSSTKNVPPPVAAAAAAAAAVAAAAAATTTTTSSATPAESTPDSPAPPHHHLQQQQQPPQSSISSTSGSLPPNSSSTNLQQLGALNGSANNLSPADELRQSLDILAARMMSSLEVKDRKFLLRTYKDCFVGTEAVDWLLSRGVAEDEEDAVRIGNLMIKNNLFQHVTLDHLFKNENLFYRYTSTYGSDLDSVLASPPGATPSPAISTPTPTVGSSPAVGPSNSPLATRKMSTAGSVMLNAGAAAAGASSDRPAPLLSTGSVSSLGGRKQRELQTIVTSMKHFVDVRDRKYMRKMYRRTFLGKDAANWLIWTGVAQDVDDAIGTGNRMLQKGLIRSINGSDQSFKYDSSALYRFSEEGAARVVRKPTSAAATTGAAVASAAAVLVGGVGAVGGAAASLGKKAFGGARKLMGKVVKRSNTSVGLEDVPSGGSATGRPKSEAGSVSSSDPPSQPSSRPVSLISQPGEVVAVGAEPSGHRGLSSATSIDEADLAEDDEDVEDLDDDDIVDDVFDDDDETDGGESSSKSVVTPLPSSPDLAPTAPAPLTTSQMAAAAAAPASASASTSSAGGRIEESNPIIANYYGKRNAVSIADVKSVMNLSIEACFERAQLGSMMMRSKVNKPPAWFRVTIDKERKIMYWRYKSGITVKNALLLGSIRDVRLGASKQVFETKLVAEVYARSFSIVYGPNWEEVHFTSETLEDFFVWSRLLEHIAEQARLSAPRNASILTWLKLEFLLANQVTIDTISGERAVFLLDKLLNFSKTEPDIPRKFLTMLEHESMTFQQVARAYVEHTMPAHVEVVFHQYAKTESADGKLVMNLECFLDFLYAQGETDIFDDEGSIMIRKYSSRNNEQLDLVDFALFLLSDDNIVVRKAHLPLHEDMTRPLSEYFIASSHNTYLLGDQLKGESSIEGYIRSLLEGCRCVELDCWDGSDGEPIIYHGHTLTTKIRYVDVLKAIKTYAFKASPYPVILSFENHCSIPQQVIIAKYLRSIFHDALLDNYLVGIDSETQLPSPEQLKYKILVKAKGNKRDDPTMSGVGPVAATGQLSTPRATGRRMSLGDALVKPRGSRSNTLNKATQPSEQDLALSANDMRELGAKDASAVAPAVTAKDKKETRDKDKDKETKEEKEAVSTEDSEVEKVAPELAELAIYCRAAHFVSFEDNMACQVWYQMTSIGESKAKKLAQTNLAEYTLYNQRFLNRIYPAAKRFNSSNFDPQQFWNTGSQMVALNYQTNDIPMMMNRGKFQVNGLCGYVLKPASIIGTPDAQPAVPKQLSVQILSAQNVLHYSEFAKFRDSEFVVEVRVDGASTDTARKKTNSRTGTPARTEWNETLNFNVGDSELALIGFMLYENKSRRLLGQFFAPVSSLNQGFRHIYLKGEGDDHLHHQTLFVNIAIEDLLDGADWQIAI